MRNGDRHLETIDLGNGAKLERVINAGGEAYSLIIVNGVELYSTPTYSEKRMLDWYKKYK